MSTDRQYSGGCQCGAVRYRADTRPADAHICHCRMCQKAAGNYFLPLGRVAEKDLHFTRGAASWFQSSQVVRRGFCSHCGTPLFYQTLGSAFISIALGSLDRPMDVAPEWQSDTEMSMPWFAILPGLRGTLGEADADAEETLRYQTIRTTSHQHPDCDTRNWPERDQEQ